MITQYVIIDRLFYKHRGILWQKLVLKSKANIFEDKYVYAILVYNSNQIHKSQSLVYLTTALHVSGVTITHLQEHKTTVTTASGKHYTVIERVKF